MAPKRFLILCAAIVLGLAALAVGICVAVDPYRVYGTAPVFAWTALKPKIYNQAVMTKTYALERVRPTTLILGNSRAEIGFDPDSSRWPSDAQPVFNAAIAGHGYKTALSLLRDCTVVCPLKMIIVGLDIQDFLQNPELFPSDRDGPDERRLLWSARGAPNPERPLQRLRDVASTTISIDALTDSAATLLDQDPSSTITMTPRGFNPLNDYRVFVARQGAYALFERKKAEYPAQYGKYPAPDFKYPAVYSSFRYLKDILDVARSKRISVRLFIYPYHSDYLEMLHELRLWDSFENWKRALVRVLKEEEQSGLGDDLLVDFSGYNEFTTEKVPPPQDRHSVMTWYWEPGHFKASLGEKVLERLLLGRGQFGRALTAENVEQVLAEIRASRQRMKDRDIQQ